MGPSSAPHGMRLPHGPQRALPLLLLVVAAATAERCNLDPVVAPRAKRCASLYVAGGEATGSTLAYQLLRGVLRLANATHATVKKDHRTPAADLDAACATLTIRDPRDSVCSHAKRKGIRGDKRFCGDGAPDCDAATLEDRTIPTASYLFPRHAQRLDEFEALGALVIRYEDVVDCPERLARLFAHWLGLERALPAGFAESLAADSSIEANAARAEGIGRHFVRFDPETGVHGRHVSQGGRTGAWRDCLTDRALRRVEGRAGRDWLRSRGYEPATPPRPHRPVAPAALPGDPLSRGLRARPRRPQRRR